MGSGVYETSLGHMVRRGEVSAGFEGNALQMIMERDNPLILHFSGPPGLPEAISRGFKRTTARSRLMAWGEMARALFFTQQCSPARAHQCVGKQLLRALSFLVAGARTRFDRK